jgi:hypothetical protein
MRRKFSEFGPNLASQGESFLGRICTMTTVSHVSVASLDGITEHEETLFCAFRDANPDLASPYFSVDFLEYPLSSSWFWRPQFAF